MYEKEKQTVNKNAALKSWFVTIWYSQFLVRKLVA